MSKFMPEWFIYRKRKNHKFSFSCISYFNVMFAENKEGRAKKHRVSVKENFFSFTEIIIHYRSKDKTLCD